MKKNYIYIIVILFFCHGCKKFLIQEPTNNISVDITFKDLEGARAALLGCYDRYSNINYALRNNFIFADLMGGNIKYTKPTGLSFTRTYDFNNTTLDNDNLSFYKQAYSVIYSANSIIANINKIADANDLQKNRLLAEAYTFRAISHFDLVKNYALPYNYTSDASHKGIILVTEIKALDDFSGLSSTVGQVYSQIKKDLDSAVILFNNSTSLFSNGNDKSFLSKNAALAFKARASLYSEDYQGAFNAANSVLQLPNSYTLTTRNNYVNSWSKKNTSSENIFELNYGTRLSSTIGDYFNPNKITTVQMAATNDLYNLFATNDIRGRATMFITKTINNNNFNFNLKYQGTDDSANNIKILRASELYLIRAEANAFLNNLPMAVQDLSTVKLRANPLATGGVNNLNQFMDSLFIERRRELCFEGHLFYDITRLKRNLVRSDCAAQTCSINYPSTKFALPIPQ